MVSSFCGRLKRPQKLDTLFFNRGGVGLLQDGSPVLYARGRLTVKVLPFPGSLATMIRPPWASTIRRLM